MTADVKRAVAATADRLIAEARARDAVDEMRRARDFDALTRDCLTEDEWADYVVALVPSTLAEVLALRP